MYIHVRISWSVDCIPCLNECIYIYFCFCHEPTREKMNAHFYYISHFDRWHRLKQSDLLCKLDRLKCYLRSDWTESCVDYSNWTQQLLLLREKKKEERYTSAIKWFAIRGDVLKRIVNSPCIYFNLFLVHE